VSVTFSTLIDVAIQPPLVYAMEMLPLQPNVYDKSSYNPATDNCFTGCNALLYTPYYGAPTSGLEMMVATFSTPVDYVDVTLTSPSYFGAWVQAFNSQNQLIGYDCAGGFGALPCLNGVFTDELTLSEPGIAYVAISSYEGVSQVQSINYAVPEPGPSVLFALGCLLLWAWRTKCGLMTRT
jgi:hypothetical protein